MTLKFYTNMAKVLKLKVRKFLGLNPTFVEVRGGKLVERPFYSPSQLKLNYIKTVHFSFCIKTAIKTKTSKTFIYFELTVTVH